MASYSPAPLWEDYTVGIPHGDFGEYYDEPPDPSHWDTAARGRAVTWLGDRENMVMATAAYTSPLPGNIFDSGKLGAVVAAILEGRELTFSANRAQAHVIDLQTVAESQRLARAKRLWEDNLSRPFTTADDELDEYLAGPEEFVEEHAATGTKAEAKRLHARMKRLAASAEREGAGDLGKIHFQIRDGNHRVFGALAADEPYVYVRIDESMSSVKPEDVVYRGGYAVVGKKRKAASRPTAKPAVHRKPLAAKLWPAGWRVGPEGRWQHSKSLAAKKTRPNPYTQWNPRAPRIRWPAEAVRCGFAELAVPGVDYVFHTLTGQGTGTEATEFAQGLLARNAAIMPSDKRTEDWTIGFPGDIEDVDEMAGDDQWAFFRPGEPYTGWRCDGGIRVTFAFDVEQLFARGVVGWRPHDLFYAYSGIDHGWSMPRDLRLIAEYATIADQRLVRQLVKASIASLSCPKEGRRLASKLTPKWVRSHARPGIAKVAKLVSWDKSPSLAEVVFNGVLPLRAAHAWQSGTTGRWQLVR